MSLTTLQSSEIYLEQTQSDLTTLSHFVTSTTGSWTVWYISTAWRWWRWRRWRWSRWWRWWRWYYIRLCSLSGVCIINGQVGLAGVPDLLYSLCRSEERRGEERRDIISIFIIQCRYQDGPGQGWSGGWEGHTTHNKVGEYQTRYHTLSVYEPLPAGSPVKSGQASSEKCFIYQAEMRLIGVFFLGRYGISLSLIFLWYFVTQWELITVLSPECWDDQSVWSMTGPPGNLPSYSPSPSQSIIIIYYTRTQTNTTALSLSLSLSLSLLLSHSLSSSLSQAENSSGCLGLSWQWWLAWPDWPDRTTKLSAVINWNSPTIYSAVQSSPCCSSSSPAGC